MTSGGEIGRIAEDAVGAPGDHMRHAGGHLSPASGAPIGLLGLRSRNRLHGPGHPAAGLRALPSGAQPVE